MSDGVPTAVAVCEYICKSIVSDPDAVDVEVDGDDERFELTVTVGDGDTGRVIGRRGRTAQAIRAVVRAAAAKDGAEVDVEFAD
ncbi:MAG: KH domain-containing protein [Acidimicrobiales bacterium]|nr:KH domain-containing protein [Acidimicrobiales bacterium]